MKVHIHFKFAHVLKLNVLWDGSTECDRSGEESVAFSRSIGMELDSEGSIM